MADGPGVDLQSPTMRQVSPSADLALDDDLSTHGDQDDPVDRDPEYTEERFRVDRRKLEHMLQVAGEMPEQAEEFFQKIMDETSTQITWPSKLKIGAKSKKDPHIKVAGKRDAVAEAKDKVLAVLDTKSNRVTLKMDVSHTDHSHVIGKGGNNIKRVMQETGCHIHFPDSNRGSQGEKSNQVSIAGQPVGVEQARGHIRELLPLVFMFELPVTGLLQPIPDASSPTIQQIQNTYNVTVTFKQRPRVYYTTVIIRGCVNNAKAVKEATALLVEHLTGNHGATLLVNTQLEIAPQHHLFMIGRSGANIKQIMQRTGASIHFPDPNTVTPQRKGTVYINGSIESVYLARQQLIGCLPLVLMFDMKEDTEVDQGGISHLMEQLDVFISVKPKPKQPSKSVIVKSIERNAGNMYEARRQLLGLANELPSGASLSNQDSSCHINATNSVNSLGLGALGLIGHNLLNINTNSLLMLNNVRSPMASPRSPSSPSPLISTAAGLYGPMMLLTPSSGYALQTPYTIHPQTNGLNKDLNQNSAFVRIPTPSDRTGSGSLHDGSSNDSPAGSPSCTSPIDLMSKTTTVSLGSAGMGMSPITAISSGHVSSASVSAAGSPINSVPPLRPMEVHTVKSGNSYIDVVVASKGSPESPSAADLLGISGVTPSIASSIVSGLNSAVSSCYPPADLTQDMQSAGLTSGLSSSGLAASLSSAGLTAELSSSGLAASLTSSGLASGLSSGMVTGLSSSFSGGPVTAQQITGAALSSSASSLTGLSAAISAGKQTVVLEDNVRNIPFQNGERSSESGCESDSSDHRAPGSNRPGLVGRARVTKPPPGFHNHTPTDPDGSFSFDYEKKKLLANKAMKKNPVSESPRKPTDSWYGLGLSKSMPDHAIRERLRQSNVQAYTGPSMSTTYEAADQEVDRDPWNSLCASVSPPPHPSTQDPGQYSNPRRALGNFGNADSMEMCTSSMSKSSWPAKTDLAELFSKLGLGKYTDLFQQQEIDMATFLTLTEQDLRELGTTFGARRKMLMAIADLNKRQTLMNAAPGSNNPFRDSSAAGVIGSRRLDIASQSGRW